MATPLPDDTDLAALSLDQLRHAWSQRFRESAPALRTQDLLLRAFVYRLECTRRGGPSATLKRRLTDMAQRYLVEPEHAPAPRAAPQTGATLVREWDGKKHIVHVTEDGFRYAGNGYRSLTQIAKVISGTHQSGPRFFGLIGKRERSR
jgi:hypothetical protein